MSNRVAISGFHNYTEAQQVVFGRWMRALSDVYSKHGFVKLYPRPAELVETLQQTGGVGHEVYQIARMTDGKLTELALPYDRTVPLALWVDQHANTIVFPYKRQQIDYSWRAERAQAARFRAFYQADVDMIGPNLGALADVECIATLIEGIRALGFNGFKVSLNHIEISKAMIRTGLKVSEDCAKQISREIDKLDKLTPKEVTESILAIDTALVRADVEALVAQFNYRGSLEDFKIPDTWDTAAKAAYAYLDEVFQNLIECDIDPSQLQFCPGIMRGLDYYTGVVFETHLEGEERKFGSIASGGRYDNLVAGVGEGRQLPGVGGSIGLTRLFDIFTRTLRPEEEPNVFKKRSDADCVVIFHKDEQKKTALRLAKELRLKGKNVDLCTQGGDVKLSNKLDYANRKGIRYAIMVFSDDITIKDMESGTQGRYTEEEQVIDAFIRTTADQGVLLNVPARTFLSQLI